MSSINTSHSIFVGEMVAASTHCEGQMTITQEVYRIATSTGEPHAPRGMTLRIVTHFVDATTNSSKDAKKLSIVTGNSSN